VYIWDDVDWAALRGIHNLTSFGLSLPVAQLWKLPTLLHQITDEEYATMKKNMEQSRTAYTMPGTLGAIRAFMLGFPTLRYLPLPPERAAYAQVRLFQIGREGVRRVWTRGSRSVV
ncbi:ANKMY2, partial [Symbiodinium sp. CCMP2456]